MKLLSLQIAEFKKFIEPVRIEHFDAAINLFTGPNEAGKSTLAEAIRSAFFERHRAHLPQLRPWSDSSAAPEIHLEFEHQGQHYRLDKRFLKRARCELSIDHQRFEGDDAEQQLKQLMGFQHPSRGASDQRDWGIPGLLWIEQGSAQQIAEPVSHAAGRLQEVLEGMMSELATGAGSDALMTSLRQQRHQLLTERTDKPRGDYDKAINRCEQLKHQLAELDQAIAHYQSRVDELARLKQEQRDEQQQQTLTRLAEQLEASRAALSEWQAKQQQLSSEQNAMAALDRQLALLKQSLDDFTAQQQQQESYRAALAASHTALDELTLRLTDAKTRSTTASEQRRQHQRLLEQARQRADSDQHQQQLVQLEQQHRARHQQLTRAKQLVSTIQDLTQRKRSLSIDSAAVKALHEQQAALNEINVEQRVAATQLRYQLDSGQQLKLGDRVLSGTGDAQLVDTTQLVIPDVGTLTITPGGAGLAQLSERAETIAQHLQQKLAQLGVTSLEEADQRLATLAELDGELQLAEARYADSAPQGLDALQRQLDALEADIAQQRTALEHTAIDASDEPLPDLDALVQQQRELEQLSEQAEQQWHQLQLDAGRAEVEHQRNREQLERLVASLESAERQQRLTSLRNEHSELERTRQQHQQRHDALQESLAAAPLALLEQDVERLTRSLEKSRQRDAQRRDTITRLEGELSSQGAQGLEEQRAELASEYARQQQRVSEFSRRAKALTLLLERLESKRQQLVQQLQAPLQEKLNHYLGILFKDASLTLDEQLVPTLLARRSTTGNHSEQHELEALSFGAREQLGVVCRLAYADLLRESGHPTLIMLDDALVHSDAERLGRMKRVLFDAATRHQLLIFTCHPDAWRDLGVDEQRIEALAQGE
ncbi:Chromosome partition protein Smc [Carnimonas sp. R-84981]|uniref:AAA family ATPase n=1 Tax=Carnimonas bestiolae TaxID=3402172 RepID=UPI003EDC77B3